MFSGSPRISITVTMSRGVAQLPARAAAALLSTALPSAAHLQQLGWEIPDPIDCDPLEARSLSG